MKASVARLIQTPASTIGRVLDRRVLKNASVLYLSQLANYVFPVVTVPYLARVLGPDAWGTVFFIQAIGLYVMLVVDYAFDSSATREVAQSPGNPLRLAEIVAGVSGARVLLAAGCVGLLAVGQVFLPALSEAGWMLWLGVFWYIGVAWRPFWFFLGIERVGVFLSLEVISKTAAVGGIVLLVNSPRDAWWVFALQGAASAFTTLAGMIFLYRIVPVRVPSIASSIRWLKNGWDLFIYRASASVYSMSNTIILGFIAPSVIVGYYAGAERISRIITSMMYPVLQAMFPRASSLAQDNPLAGARLARLSTTVVFVGATLGAIVLFFLAPFVIRVFLGPGYDETVPVLRILLITLPIVGISIPLSMHWLIPLGLERILTKITFTGGMIHVPLAIFLGSRHGQNGAAWALVITESLMLSLLVFVTLSRGLGPFRLPVPRDEPEGTLLP